MTAIGSSIDHRLLAALCAALFVAGSGCADSAETDTAIDQSPLALAAAAGTAAFAAGPVAGAGKLALVGTGTAASCTEVAFTAALAAGSKVTFNCGGPKTITITTPKIIAKTVTVDGDSLITLSGNSASRLFNVTSAGALTLNDITLTSAVADGNGAAIASHGKLNLSRVTVSHSVAMANGVGAIYSDGPLTDIDSCTFTNDAASSGGALFLDTALAVAHVSNSEFSDNVASSASPSAGFGGAIAVNSSAHLVLSDSVLSFNRAQSGAALFVAPGGVVDIFGSPTTTPAASAMEFNSNSAQKFGGAIYNQGSSLTISNASFSLNSLPDGSNLGFGGAIANAGRLAMSNCLLYKNHARYGGGINIGNEAGAVAVANIDTTLFKLNSSSIEGGGLFTSPYSSGIPQVYISHSGFDYNSAGSLGGGLARADSELHVDSSSFTNNTAGTDGGGLLIEKSPQTQNPPYVRIQNVTISSNSAPLGAGVYNRNAGLELYSTTIVNNAGGVYNENGNTHFRATVLQNPNHANCGSAGGSYSDDQGNVVSDSSCQLSSHAVQVTGLDVLFGSLTKDPAGVTYFHRPTKNSPLTDAGYSCPSLDQIGATRLGACDTGAIEAGSRSVPPRLSGGGTVAQSP